MDLPSRKWGERNVKLKKKMQIYCTSEEKNSRAEERSLVVVRGLKGGWGGGGNCANDGAGHPGPGHLDDSYSE